MSDEDYQKPSKSERKRADQALQVMGGRLIEMSREQLAKMPLSEELRDAIAEAQRMRSHGAKRRQLQYIGRVMRDLDDPEPLRAALALLDAGHARSITQQHSLEKWRSRLLADGDSALDALLTDYPSADRQRLRQLVRQAQHESEEDKPPRSARMIFRYLSELMASKS